MTTYRNMTARADRRRRQKAIVAPVMLHPALLAFFLVGNNINWADKLPTALKDVLGIEQVEAPAQDMAGVKP